MGAAIETPTFVASCLEKRVKKIEKVIDNLGYIEDPQCALGILRSCLGAPKLVYSLRCNTPSAEINIILEKFDHLQRTTFENILGSVISDNSWEQACLPISKTGAGVRRSLNQFKAAYVGSLSQSANIVEQITGVNPTHEISFPDLVEEFSALGIPHLTQQRIQEQFDNTALSNLLECQTSTREKARLLSLSLPQSGDWLTAAPIPALGLHLQPNEFRAALKYLLGVPIYDSDRRCPYCKSAILDIFGDHAVSCHGRGDIISRHDRVRDTIMTASSSANLSPVCEQKHLLPENNSRPGDVYLPSFIAGQPAALDVTITSPQQASLISDAARTCGFALTLAEDRKIGHYYQKCSDMGIHFIPLALETFGELSETTRKRLKRIALLSDNRGFQPSGLSVAFSRLAQAVSISTMRGSATMLIARDSRL